MLHGVHDNITWVVTDYIIAVTCTPKNVPIYINSRWYIDKHFLHTVGTLVGTPDHGVLSNGVTLMQEKGISKQKAIKLIMVRVQLE